MRWSQPDITAALTGLTPEEKQELLALLEARAQQEARSQIDDNRPPIGQMLEAVIRQEAAKCDDPAAYLAAHAAHDACHEKHYAELMRDHDLADADIGEWAAVSAAAWNKASELATAKGHPSPDWRDFVSKVEIPNQPNSRLVAGGPARAALINLGIHATGTTAATA
jgi:hypothetical protein